MSRRALIDIACEALAEAVGVLNDAGVRIVDSVAGARPGAVRFIIEGDALPQECARGGLKVVSALMTLEVYGRQRICRVERFDIVAEWVQKAA